MIIISTFIIALLIVLTRAASLDVNRKNASYNLKNLQQIGQVVTVTVKKPIVTVYQPTSVTVIVSKELAAHSKVVIETAVVTETVFAKHPNFYQRDRY